MLVVFLYLTSILASQASLCIVLSALWDGITCETLCPHSYFIAFQMYSPAGFFTLYLSTFCCWKNWYFFLVSPFMTRHSPLKPGICQVGVKSDLLTWWRGWWRWGQGAGGGWWDAGGSPRTWASGSQRSERKTITLQNTDISAGKGKCVSPKWHHIPFIVHYFCLGP